jgi:hypothetical protein
MHKGQQAQGIVQCLQGLDLLHAADGVINAGALALDYIKLDAQRRQRGEDVTEEDDTIGLERAPRLQDGAGHS